MKQSLLFICTLFYLLSPLSNAADMKIYRWVDEDGKVHFSDTAVPGTEEIDVKNNNLFSTGSNDAQQNDAVDNELTLDEDEVAIQYQATITSPENDKALRSNDGSINIQVVTKPEKNNTQKLQLYLDGKKLGSPQISSTIRALNIDRGTHQVQVELLDENGSMLAKTQIVTVHLQRATTRK